MLVGGFPEMATRGANPRNRTWFRAYSSTVVQRQVLDIANIDASGDLTRLLALLAARATGLANVTSLANDLGMAPTTMKRYLNLLRMTYIVQALPAWTRNAGMRLIRTEKLTLLDTGLLGYLQNAEAERVVSQRDMAGPLLETFVMMELRKQLGWSDIAAELYFFRTHSGLEVDLVIESLDGRIVAVEVKSAASVGKRDFRGLEFLRDQLGERFIRGILLYTGEQVLPAGDRIWVMPVDSLWRWGARPQTA
jgi:predicted AAA+ superfamily ATPase